MDGKHVAIKQPPNSGSYCFNYKGTLSMVLLALVDANYKFIYVDVVCNGRVSVGRVFWNCSLSTTIESNMVSMPAERIIVDEMEPLPYVIVADDTSSLRNDLMKRYPFSNLFPDKRIFNYRLSRAGRIVENAFGILANSFRVFLSPMQLSPKNFEKVVLGSCVLQNFLREKSPLQYTLPGSFDNEDIENGKILPGNWRSNDGADTMQLVNVIASNNYPQNCKEIRDWFRDFFSATRKVLWPDKFILQLRSSLLNVFS